MSLQVPAHLLSAAEDEIYRLRSEIADERAAHDVTRGEGVGLIAAERQRQVNGEGWTLDHDDDHDRGEMAAAAAVYAMPVENREMVQCSTAAPGMPSDRGDAFWLEPRYWPWDSDWYKPTPDDRVRELVKAGALIAAEIDRLQRAKEAPRG